MKSLYGKFALSTILIMLLSGLLAFVFSNMYYQHALKLENDRKITKFTLEITSFIQNNPTINLFEYLDHLGSIGYQVYIENEHGRRQFFGTSFREQNLTNKAIKDVLSGKIYHGVENFPHTTFVTGFFANELKNTVGAPFHYDNQKYAIFIRPDIKVLFNEMHLLFGWLLLMSISLSILFVLISTKYLVRPIVKLNMATKTLAEGNFTIHLDIKRRDEIGALASNFMIMASQLAGVNSLRKEFISNVSHDIQSPITNIKGYLQLLDDARISDGEKKNYLQIIHSEITRLSNLSSQLLILSSIDSKKDLMEISEFDVADQIKSVIQQYFWKISERELMLSYSLPPTKIKGDKFLLYSAWENLLTNAIKYNVECGSIDITVISKIDKIEVQFIDSGIGLDSEQVERIYDRFYRADLSRTTAIEGTGLGLSIVHTIIQMHGGTIHVESKPNIGSTFKVILPK